MNIRKCPGTAIQIDNMGKFSTVYQIKHKLLQFTLAIKKPPTSGRLFICQSKTQSTNCYLFDFLGLMALSILAISFFCQRSTNAAIAFSFFSAIFSSRTWRFLVAITSALACFSAAFVAAIRSLIFRRASAAASSLFGPAAVFTSDGEPLFFWQVSSLPCA